MESLLLRIFFAFFLRTFHVFAYIVCFCAAGTGFSTIALGMISMAETNWQCKHTFVLRKRHLIQARTIRLRDPLNFWDRIVETSDLGASTVIEALFSLQEKEAKSGEASVVMIAVFITGFEVISLLYYRCETVAGSGLCSTVGIQTYINLVAPTKEIDCVIPEAIVHYTNDQLEPTFCLQDISKLVLHFVQPRMQLDTSMTQATRNLRANKEAERHSGSSPRWNGGFSAALTARVPPLILKRKCARMSLEGK